MQLYVNIPSYITTKGGRAEYLYGADAQANKTNPIETYDCAVPQQWADFAGRRGFPDASRHVVTAYYKDGAVRLMPITDYGIEVLATLATYAGD